MAFRPCLLNKKIHEILGKEVKAVYTKNASEFAINNTDRVNKTRENLLIITFTTYSYTDLSHLNGKVFTQISPIELQTSRVQKSQIFQNVFDLKFLLPGIKVVFAPYLFTFFPIKMRFTL